MSLVDWLILIPAIPLAPFIITWWLPWERWVPWGKIPKPIGIPYLWYMVGVAWHFRLHWWAILCFAVTALIVTISTFVDAWRKKQDKEI